MATELEVSEVIAGAAALYTNFKYGPGVNAASFARAWHRHVGHLAADDLQAAMDRAVAGTEFFPSVHEVLKAHAALAAGQGKTGLEAWGELLLAIDAHGFYDPPEGEPPPADRWLKATPKWTFPDPLIAQLVKSFGGWGELCRSDDVMVNRAHFVKAYEAMRARGLDDAMRLPAPAQKELTP